MTRLAADCPPVFSPLLLIALAVVGVCGCRESRVAVQGRVTLDGKPLSEAAVLFVPLSAARKKTGAVIEDGHYDLPAENGLAPGAYRVEIADNPPLNGATKVRAASSPSLPARRKLPAKYGHQSPLRIEIAEPVPDKPREFNVELSGAP